jgi:hypothetical protein
MDTLTACSLSHRNPAHHDLEATMLALLETTASFGEWLVLAVVAATFVVVTTWMTVSAVHEHRRRRQATATARRLGRTRR